MARRLSAFLMVVACVAAGPALAQAPGTPLRGTIETVASGTMSIATSDGQVSVPSRRRSWRRIHHSPLFWVAVFLCLAAISVYVLSNDLSWRPRIG